MSILSYSVHFNCYIIYDRHCSTSPYFTDINKGYGLQNPVHIMELIVLNLDYAVI